MFIALLTLASCLPPAPPQAKAVEIVAHRGASADAPENTVASIRLAWEQGADAAEFDVYLTKDGKIAVLHDQNLRRTAGLDRKVTDLTLDELKKLDVGRWKGERFSGELLPSLEDVLATVPPGKRVFIEVKCGPEIVPELSRVIEASRLKPEQTAIISFSADVVAAAKRARPDLMAYWIVSLGRRDGHEPPTALDLVAKAREIKADGLDLSAVPAVLTPEFGRAIKEAGLALHVWTVDDVNVALAMVAAGVDGITTNRPGQLRRQLTPTNDAGDLKVMSFNIRYGTANDGDNAWDRRKDLLIRTIHAFDPDLLGTQETLASQRDDMASALSDYEPLAAGRDDGRDGGEMMALFFRKARFEKLDGGHFWLSESPEVVGSKGWDTSLPRMVTWVKLRDRSAADPTPVVYLNTHFDHRGPRAREESARLLRRKVDELARGCRVVVGGDFNAAEASDPYKILFGGNTSASRPVVDTFRAVHPVRGDEEGTFSAFKAGPVRGGRIDWIGCSTDWEVKGAAIDWTSEGGRTPSDHFPITAILRPIPASSGSKAP